MCAWFNSLWRGVGGEAKQEHSYKNQDKAVETTPSLWEGRGGPSQYAMLLHHLLQLFYSGRLRSQTVFIFIKLILAFSDNNGGYSVTNHIGNGSGF